MSSRLSKEERRRELLAVARDVFFEKGFGHATIEDIVAKAQVARGTFYLYFPNKRAIYEALIDDFLGRIGDSIHTIRLGPEAEPPALQLRANLVRLIQLAHEEPAIVKIALFDASGLDPELDEKLQGYFGALRALLDHSLAEGQTIGLVREGNREVMIAVAFGALREVLGRAVSGDIQATPEQIADEILRIVAGGFLLGPG